MSVFTNSSKSILAKLLATENITIQHDPAQKTAWFDLKNRVLSLPVWHDITEDLYDMLVVHEVGHALDTPTEEWLENIKTIAERATGKKNNSGAEAAVKDFMNVIEDARIDKRQKRRYPGSVRNYVKGYKELIDRDFFGTAKKDINSFSFIDRLNMYFKGGVMLGIKFSAEERKFVDAVANAETFAEVLELTEQIFTYAKDTEKFSAETAKSTVIFLDDEGDEEFDADDFEDVDFDDDFDDDEEDSKGSNKSSDDGEDDEDSEDDGESDGSGDDSEDDESDESEETDDGDDTGTGPEGGKGEGGEDIPQSQTEQAWRKMQNQLVVDDGCNYIYGKLPTPILNNIVDDYKVVMKDWEYSLSNNGYSPEWQTALLGEFNTWKNKENSTISYMVKEFEMLKAASAYSKTLTAKTGVIDTGKLHSYKFSEDIFRKNTVVPKGKNHGMVMFLDWSGSMGYHLRKTVLQTFSLAMFCRRVQIPFEVYLFRDLGARDDVKECWNHDGNSPYVGLDHFKLRNILSSRMSGADFNKMMAFIYGFANNKFRPGTDGMGGTPLNEAIVAAMSIVPQFQARNKIEVMNVIFLTDGGSDMDHMVNYKSNGRKKLIYIQDEVTKKNHLYYDSSKYYETYMEQSRASTTVLYNILKDRTNCNLIGFYLFGDKIKQFIREWAMNESYEIQSKYTESWRKDGYVALVNSGFDEYYFLNTDKFGISDNKLEIDSTMKHKAMVKEFAKFSENKGASRVLLRRFISRISRNVA
jgi:hypothetical protein